MPFSWNISPIGYHDLAGRPGFKLAMQEIDERFFLYVAPMWQSGMSVLEVTNPARPELLRWVDGPPNTWTIQVQVADGLAVTGMEHIPAGWTFGERGGPSDGVALWDVSVPDDPRQVGTWASGGTGTHRNFYAGGRYVHCAANLPGYEGQFYVALDIEDPRAPRVVGRWWWPGQHVAGGEHYTEADLARWRGGRPYPPDSPQHALSLHGGAYVSGDRAYCPWMRAGLVILDVADPGEPRLVSHLSMYPPLGSTIATHTAVPLDDRALVVVNSEALNERRREPVGYAGIVDVSDERDPVLVSLFPQPRTPPGYPFRSFREKGGRFGPHNQHQPQGQACLAPYADYTFLTYFNAGLQVFDISDPYDPYIAAYYIPDDPPDRRGPLPSDLVVQVEDVLVDRRGVIYISEKNSGLTILGMDGFTQLT